MSASTVLKSKCGTPVYMAPEMLQNQSYNESVDIWASGILLYTVLSGTLPFYADNPDDFFYVFTIIFPAFTGIAAGLGLSGDLKDPKKSIPKGTLWATAVGIIVYFAVAIKLVLSASTEQLANNQMVMADISLWGPIIPIGLACAAVSSALGSVIIAPRTLQALGNDSVFPINKWQKAKGY